MILRSLSSSLSHRNKWCLCSGKQELVCCRLRLRDGSGCRGGGWRCVWNKGLCACLCVQVSTEAEAVPQSDAQTFTIGVMPQIPGFPQLAPDCDLQITVRNENGKNKPIHHGNMSSAANYDIFTVQFTAFSTVSHSYSLLLHRAILLFDIHIFT